MLDIATHKTYYCRNITVQKMMTQSKCEVVRSRYSYINNESLQRLITKGDKEIFEKYLKKFKNMIELIGGNER